MVLQLSNITYVFIFSCDRLWCVCTQCISSWLLELYLQLLNFLRLLFRMCKMNTLSDKPSCPLSVPSFNFKTRMFMIFNQRNPCIHMCCLYWLLYSRSLLFQTQDTCLYWNTTCYVISYRHKCQVCCNLNRYKIFGYIFQKLFCIDS
jgi:hypothetical protein